MVTDNQAKNTYEAGQTGKIAQNGGAAGTGFGST